MAKDIKVIKCPQCGSTEKTEIKPDFFKCNNCGATYYLDNDDINVNVNYGYVPVSQVSKPKAKAAAFVVIGFVAIMLIFFFLLRTSISASDSPAAGLVREPYSYDKNYVYLNTNTQQPVLVRIGSEGIRSKNGNYDFVNIHSVFIDPATKKQLSDDVLIPKVRRLDPDNYDFQAFANGKIYMIYNNARLFSLDREKNQLIEVTAALFKDHPELTAGIAAVKFMQKDVLDILSNDGSRMYYIVEADQMFPEKEYKKMMEIWYAKYNTTIFKEDNSKLMKLNSKVKTDLDYVDLTPGRKYFDMGIAYQDKTNLLIKANVNASETSALMLQYIDVNTGQIKWTYPAAHYFIGSIVKYKEGFAVEYWAGENMDYIRGVLMISNEGKLLQDYLIKRNE